MTIDILVYDKGNLLGTFTVPKPSENQLLTVYEEVPFTFKGTYFDIIDILYMQDLNYGIAITDKMVDYIKQNK